MPYACTGSPFISFVLHRLRGFIFLLAPASRVNLPNIEVSVDPSPGFKINAFVPVFAFAFARPSSSSPWEDLANAGKVLIAQFIYQSGCNPMYVLELHMYTYHGTHTSLTAHMS